MSVNHVKPHGRIYLRLLDVEHDVDENVIIGPVDDGDKAVVLDACSTVRCHSDLLDRDTNPAH